MPRTIQQKQRWNSQLLPRKNETNLINLYPLLFLKCLFDSQDLILWFKIEGLFTARECFDKDLCFGCGHVAMMLLGL